MAIIWKKSIADNSYEVRTAGHSRRLYTNGVFHSQFNEKHPITKGVWDLLMLPALFYPSGNIQRVLVLGVGGGAVIKLLNAIIQPKEIIAVELNPMHLTIARRFFNVDERSAKLVRADAIQWLSDYQGPPFDMIIDDLYGKEKNGESERAIKLTAFWFAILNRNLTAKGLLTVNTLEEGGLKNTAYYSSQQVKKMFVSAFQFTLPTYENCVGAFLKCKSTVRILRSNMDYVANQNARRALQKLPFKVKTLS